MAFFDDLFSAVTGQQTAPQATIIPTADLLAQSYGALNSQVAPGLINFNAQLAGVPGATSLTDIGLGVADKLSPSILGNLRGAQTSILDQLNLGTQMSPELQAEITRNLLSTNTASGFGASAGGVGNVLYQTALDKEALGRQRRLDALGAGGQGLAQSQTLYNPDLYSQIGTSQANAIAGDIQQVQAARDELANVTENIRQQNFASLLNTGGKIAGTVAGGIFGGPGGAAIGGNIGGSLIQGGGVGGQPKRSAGGGGLFSGIMDMFGGGDAGQPVGGGIGGGGMGFGASFA